MISLPHVRAGLLRHRLDEQVLIYDPRDDRVHLLDPTTACVLELLEEGGHSMAGIISELSRRLDVGPSEELVTLAIDELRKADLLDKDTATLPALGDVTRREALRKVGLTGAAALLIPAIATLTATSASAQASGASCVHNGGACTTQADCCPGCNCTGNPKTCSGPTCT
jgi:PqqD family protein of HPr-rel-A system